MPGDAERRMRGWVADDDGADPATLRQWELEMDEWWGSGSRRAHLGRWAAVIALAATAALYAAARRRRW